MKTIRQIAEEIGVTKQAIQKRISREPLFSRIRAHSTTNGNTMYIDGAGEKLIKSAFYKVQSTTLYTNLYTPVYDRKTQNICADFIRVLQEQLAIKDRQIAELTDVIKIQAWNAKRIPKKKIRTFKKPIASEVKSVPIKRLFDGS